MGRRWETGVSDIDLLLLGVVVAVAVAGFSVLARRIDVPYPILLILGCLGAGLPAGVPAVELPPELVLG